MVERPSNWTRALVLVAVVAGSALIRPAGAGAQDDLDAVCALASAAPTDCGLAAAAVRLIQPRVALMLWGGNPVPGTASTLGRRLPGSARLAGSVRVTVVPIALPPLLDRRQSSGSTAFGTTLSVQGSLGLSHGLSPLPTVGGFLSMDLIGRASYGRIADSDFDPATVLGGAAGLRVGLLRESFTLPGVSVTGMVGRSTTVTYGDPEGAATDGSIEGAVTALSATGAASKRIFGLRLTGGAAYDRYVSDVAIRFGPAVSGPQVSRQANAQTDRVCYFASVTWTRLVYHTVLEGGWQEAPVPRGLAEDIDLSPVGWWASVSFRVTL